MRSATNLIGCVLLAAGLSATAAHGEELSVKLTVVEPAGAARRAFPATGGIPFRPGQVADVAGLMLVDAQGRPVPAQFSKLAGYDDGSLQWALVDLVADLPPGGRLEYTLKAGRSALPARPLVINETDERVVVDTGTVKFAVSKVDFGLFDEVIVDGRKAVTGSSVTLENCELAERTGTPQFKKETPIVAMKEGGRVFPCRTGRPARVTWEYRGPVRATLRVDGDYLGPGGPKLSYTTRITAWAGVGLVRVEHSIRNSNPAEGSDAYIRRAALTLKLGFTAEPVPVAAPAGDQAGPVNLDWCAGGDGTTGVMIQNRHAGLYRGPGTYLRRDFDCGFGKPWPGLFVQSVNGGEATVELVSEGPQSRNPRGALGFTADGTFALADRSHKDTEVWFDFYAGARDAAANRARADACRSRLLAVAPGEWYSATEALGSGHFGTLADEIATYRKWGWKGWDQGELYPKMSHQPFAFVPFEMIHEVTEDDAVEGYLLQFLRTGQRGFFDWAEAYAGFFRCHAIARSDWGARWGGPEVAETVQVDPAGKPRDKAESLGPGVRPNRGLGFGWYGPQYYDWADTRMHPCHEYGRGIFDYYCLTGSTDALEAGLDLAAEVASERLGRREQAFRMKRDFGRALNTLVRAYQLTRDPRWKKVADHLAGLVLKDPTWSPEHKVYLQPANWGEFGKRWAAQIPGNKYYVVPPRLVKYLADNDITAAYEKGKTLAVRGDRKWQVCELGKIFQVSECHLAMERYARVADSEPMRRRLVELTRGVVGNYWSPECRFMLDLAYFGWPEENKPFDQWRWDESHRECPNDPGGQHSGYSTRYIADMCARAYSFSGDRFFLDWSRTCWSRGNKRRYKADRQFAAEDEVGEFAYIRGAHGDTILECSARMFYEWSRAE